MKKSMARVAAAEKNESVYVPEKPCLRGHALRRVSDGTCTQCKQINERQRTANNRDAYNARKKQERVTKLPVLAERMRLIRATESIEKRQKRLEQARIKQREWRQKNPVCAKSIAAKKKYKEDNPAKTRADTVKRRANKMQRTPAWLTAEDYWIIEQAYELAARRTKIFGFAWHVDHVIPLQGKYVSGLHVPTNLQVIPWRDNVAKANRYLPA